MSYEISVTHLSVNKDGEELCGDHVEVVELSDGKIIVLSDGLGSGVKANILATLTAKIAVTMLKGNATLEDTLATILATLPECAVRKLSYATFTILRAYANGWVEVVEFDNPTCFLLRKDRVGSLPLREEVLHGKMLKVAKIQLAEVDELLVVSDGVIHAGVGKLLNFGWRWEHVKEHLSTLIASPNNLGYTAHELMSHTTVLYDFHPGDDATVLSLKMKEKKVAHLFAGPPKNPQDDDILGRTFQKAEGLKVICGGTTANILSRILQKPLSVSLYGKTKGLPPMATMEDATLITEGILTLSFAVEILEEYTKGMKSLEVLGHLYEDHGASRLLKVLLMEATEVKIYMGMAVNPAHDVEGFVYDHQKKVLVVHKLKELLDSLGKKVTLYRI